MVTVQTILVHHEVDRFVAVLVHHEVDRLAAVLVHHGVDRFTVVCMDILICVQYLMVMRCPHCLCTPCVIVMKPSFLVGSSVAVLGKCKCKTYIFKYVILCCDIFPLFVQSKLDQV